MSSTNESSTRISIILYTSDDWLLWVNGVKVVATSRGVWNYINPDIEIKPTLPQRPIHPTIQRIDPNASSVIDLTQDKRELWRDWMRDYELSLREYERVTNAIAFLILIISNSLSLENKRTIIDLTDAYDILSRLKTKLAPTNEARKRDLIRRYHAMRRPPQSISIDAWISKWESIYIEAIQLEIGEVLDLSRPLFDFIEAVSTISPYFTEIWHDKLTEKQEKNEPLPPFYTITKKFRDSIKLNQTKESKRLKIAHATLQGKSDSFKSTNQDETTS